MKLARAAIFAALPLAFVAVLTVGVFRSTGPKARVGDRAPEFELARLGSGGTISSDSFRGRPLVVNFWASWCTSCKQEAPALEGAYQKFRARVGFLGVAIKDAPEDSLRFAETFRLTYALARDPAETLARRFGVRGVPETFFIDSRYRFFGFAGTEAIGKRGSTVVLGAVPVAVLHSQIEAMLQAGSASSITRRRV